jgi:predicted RNA binding protein YcfA (HicA-like mRNA interferase family)
VKIPRDISAKSIIKLLESIGYSVSRQKGSHIRLSYQSSDTSHHITIPNHDPVKIGTLNNILNDLSTYHKIDKEELIATLQSF